jgi:hypothetical protein
MKHRTLAIRPVLVAGGVTISAALAQPSAHADEVAYLVNVMVRPGYNFASAADALAYGHNSIVITAPNPAHTYQSGRTGSRVDLVMGVALGGPTGSVDR